MSKRPWPIRSTATGPQLAVATQVDTPLSLEELNAAALDMQRNKSLGFDGIPPQVYVEFWVKRGLLLVDMIMTSIDRSSFQEI